MLAETPVGFSRREFRNREAVFWRNDGITDHHASVGANSGIVRRGSLGGVGIVKTIASVGANSGIVRRKHATGATQKAVTRFSRREFRNREAAVEH